MRDEVVGCAKQIFFDQRVHHTKDAVGVLLYVSLFERMAAVMADERVMATLGQDRIDQICRELTGRLRRDEPIDALCATAESVGDLLAPDLPRRAGDSNDLPDALVVLE